jgi:predicted O-methyltransferase YrrM
MPLLGQNYIHDHAAAWSELFRSYRSWDRSTPKTCVEIGTFHGSSALWIVENLLQHPQSRLVCIDAWEGDSGAHALAVFRRNLAQLSDKDRAKVEVLQSRSRDALIRLAAAGERADFIYVDGSHAAPDVLSDLVLAFGLLRVGGLMICDDYLWKDPAHDGGSILGRPKIAIDAFTNIYSEKLAWVARYPNIQACFTKKSD